MKKLWIHKHVRTGNKDLITRYNLMTSKDENRFYDLARDLLRHRYDAGPLQIEEIITMVKENEPNYMIIYPLNDTVYLELTRLD